MDLFIPIKITDRQWADLLLDGQIFMRSLFGFGSWSALDANRDSNIDNSFRGDLREGAFRVYKSPEDHPYIKDMDPDFKSIVRLIADVDMSDSQYFKIFSTYALKFNTSTQSFLPPDSKIQEFGDTAVVMHDFESFLQRVIQQLRQRFGKMFIPFLQEVSYFDYTESKDLTPLFSKHIEYSYQNELRLAVGLLEENQFSMDFSDTIILSTDSLTLDIGNIRDIAYAIPVQELIDLRLPNEPSFRFPTLGNQDSYFFNMVRYSKEDLERFLCPTYKPILTIY